MHDLARQATSFLFVPATRPERLGKALDDAAAHLLLDEQRIDDTSTIVDGPLLQQRDATGFAVYFNVGRLHSVGEVAHLVVGSVARRDAEQYGQNG